MESGAILIKVLIDFAFLCAAYAYLTATESHKLLQWVAHRLYLHPSQHIVLTSAKAKMSSFRAVEPRNGPSVTAT